MDSYRARKRATQQIQLADTDAEIEPVPVGGGGEKPEPELDRLYNILQAFTVWAD
jgi:type I restriction enzyme R subunit